MLKKINLLAVLSAVLISVFSCKDEVLPKPGGHLRLDYRQAKYFPFDADCPFTFDVNSDAIVKKLPNCNLSIEYPKMKATIYMTYHPVQGNLNDLLRDVQTLTYKHVIKADNIVEQPFANRDGKVYGMFYSIAGNAATNGQFYVTDSTKHFVDCSVYFYTKPNYDSIYPAASYVKDDMQMIMETLKWKK